MKTMVKFILAVQSAGFILTMSIMAQQNMFIKGTIGKEKAHGDEVVICVLGTQACMPVHIDTTQRMNVAGSVKKLNELPTGLYVEARINKTPQGLNTIAALRVDENRTVLCFDSLSSGESARLRRLLLSTEGVKKLEAVNSSRQALVDFDSKTITYQNLESLVSKAGFALE